MTHKVSPPWPDREAFTHALMAWCVDPARFSEPPDRYLHPFVAQLNALGLQLGGANLVLHTPHPQLEMMAQRWRPLDKDEVRIDDDEGIAGHYHNQDQAGVNEVYLLARGHSDRNLYKKSPFYAADQSGTWLSWPLKPSDEEPAFPIFSDLAARGETAYVVLPIPLPQPYRAALSLSTHHRDGFPPWIGEAMEQATAHIALSMAHKVERMNLHAVLEAYLGHYAAREVAQGQLKHGDFKTIDAVIGIADLRGFTALTQRLGAEAVGTVLSEFFTLLHDAVRAARGEILKFMGDGVLFVFACKADDQQEVCDRAVASMKQLSAKLNQLNEQPRAVPIRYAAGLHLGQARYGNIGAPARLDFTVIGPCVNKAARLQERAAEHDLDLVFSSELAAALSQPSDLLESVDLLGFDSNEAVHQPLRTAAHPQGT